MHALSLAFLRVLRASVVYIPGSTRTEWWIGRDARQHGTGKTFPLRPSTKEFLHHRADERTAAQNGDQIGNRHQPVQGIGDAPDHLQAASGANKGCHYPDHTVGPGDSGTEEINSRRFTVEGPSDQGRKGKGGDGNGNQEMPPFAWKRELERAPCQSRTT